MKAITTRYAGPTNTKGSRFIATDGDGNRKVVAYDYATGSEENHRKAAYALRDKMGWSGELVSGELKPGTYAHVFIS